MTDLSFRIVNVFTRGLGMLTGNPLCVFEDGTSLDDATMLALARQFNLSETTFLLPSSVADARVRIFTPSFEMPFAGHPTLGSAFVVRALGRAGDELRLEMKAGVIPVRAQGARHTLQAKTPMHRPFQGDHGALARALGVAPSALGAPPLWLDSGSEQLLVPLNSEHALRSMQLDAQQVLQLASPQDPMKLYVFAELSPGRVLARFFFRQGRALLEDPATGSAAANLGGYWLATQHALPLSVEIDQGEYVGRPSCLLLRVDTERQVFVSGDVVELARGTLTLR